MSDPNSAPKTPDPNSEHVPDADEAADFLGLDPDDMKNPDPDEGPRSRRDLGATDEDEVDGREMADALYGGLDSDSQTDDTDE